MRRLLALVLVSGMAASCAALVGYDDLRVAGSDAGSEVSVDAPTDSAIDTVVTDTGPGGARVPSRPAGTVAPSGKGKTLWLVVDHFHLNQKDIKTGVLSADAWKSIGYDLDKVCTSAQDSKENLGTCIRPTGAKQDSLIDGNGCRDNNFGAQVVPLVGVYNAVFEDESNAAIKRGIGTLILRLDDVDDGPDDPFVRARLYKTSNFKGPGEPLWDGNDLRDVTDDSVTGGDLEKPNVRFDSGWIAGNVWVSGDGVPLDMPLPLANITMTFPLTAGRMTLELAPDHSGGKLGQVVGALPRTKLDQVVSRIGDWAGICKGSSLYDALITNISRYCDVVIGAPDLQSTSTTCDGLSFAIGYTTTAVLPPKTVVPAPVYIPKCK